MPMRQQPSRNSWEASSEGFDWPEFEEEPQLSSPGDIDPDMLAYFAAKM